MFGKLSTKLFKRCINHSKLVFRPQLALFPSRAFAVNSENNKRLIQVFGKEQEFERDNYTEVSEKSDFLNSYGYQYTEAADGVNLILTKKVGENTIEIYFKSRQPGDEEDNEVDQFQEENNESDEEDISNWYTDFTVYIIRNNNAMVFEWTSSDTELSIGQVIHTSDVEKFKKIPQHDRSDHFYLGPDFASLSDDLQITLSQYLIDNGIDQKTVAFIEVMSLDKEQRLYLKWLQDVQNFVLLDN